MHKLTYFEIHKVHKFHFEKKKNSNVLWKCQNANEYDCKVEVYSGKFPNHFKLCFVFSNFF